MLKMKDYVTGRKLVSPKNNIVATDEIYCFKQQLTLLLKEKVLSVSGDDFSIKDIDKIPYFKCEGKALTLNDKKILYDVEKSPILNIKNEVMSLKGRMKIYSEIDGKLICNVEPSNVIANRKYAVRFLNKITGNEEYIEMKCDYLASSCGIFYGEEKVGAPLICKIEKVMDSKHFLTLEDNYYVKIAPNVDAAFMIALAICFDEHKSG